MKKILFLFLLLGMVQGIWAQPEEIGRAHV